jgi:hypothetical protein
MAGIQQMLMGANAVVIDMGVDKSLNAPSGVGTGASTIRLNADGTWVGTAVPGNSGAFSSTWINSAPFAPQYEARSTTTGGKGTGSTDPSNGAWIALTADRLWIQIGTGTGSPWSFTLEIRDAATLTVRDTCLVVLAAT